MLKGYTKNIVVIRKTGSRYFESAFFILHRGISQKTSEAEILREAEKIVSSYLDRPTPPSRFRNHSRQVSFTDRKTAVLSSIPLFDNLSFFLSGIACAGFTAGAIALTAYFIW